jgi:hypothetical protein
LNTNFDSHTKYALKIQIKNSNLTSDILYLVVVTKSKACVCIHVVYQVPLVACIINSDDIKAKNLKAIYREWHDRDIT